MVSILLCHASSSPWSVIEILVSYKCSLTPSLPSHFFLLSGSCISSLSFLLNFRLPPTLTVLQGSRTTGRNLPTEVPTPHSCLTGCASTEVRGVGGAEGGSSLPSPRCPPSWAFDGGFPSLLLVGRAALVHERSAKWKVSGPSLVSVSGILSMLRLPSRFRGNLRKPGAGADTVCLRNQCRGLEIPLPWQPS